jgi:site-specific recombinase XerC
LRQGIDPRTPKAGAARLSILLADYERHLRHRQIVKVDDAISSLSRGLQRHHSKPIAELSRAACVAEIDAIEASGRPGAAQDFRKHCSAFLNWCVSQGHLPASPLGGYRRPRQTRAQRLTRLRLTYIGPRALQTLWAGLAAASDPAFRALLQLGLLTGLRRGELAALRWDHLTLSDDEPRITLPAEITKTGEMRALPLGPLSVAIVRAQPRLAGTDLLFPGRRQKPIAGWSKRLAPVKAALGEPEFGLHTLRRTYRSGLSDLGVPLDVAELMIGHQRQGLVGTYDRSEVWPARVSAQATWEGHVAAVVAEP